MRLYSHLMCSGGLYRFERSLIHWDSTAGLRRTLWIRLKMTRAQGLDTIDSRTRAHGLTMELTLGGTCKHHRQALRSRPALPIRILGTRTAQLSACHTGALQTAACMVLTVVTDASERVPTEPTRSAMT